MKKESAMKERLHEQISSELKQSARTDTVIVITAIFLSLLFLGINSGVAAAVREYDYSRNGIETISTNVTAVIILVILIVVITAINFFVLRMLSKGKERRAKLMAGLMKMYKEEGMDQYYDASVEKGYEARYNLFSAVIVSLGAVAVLIPILVSSTSC
jgi:ABC-type dipeptide/oligopeptide/nickel transport system permease component